MVGFQPTTRHPEASQANYYASRFSFSEAEGPALLHHRVLQTVWMMGGPEEQRSRPFAFLPHHAKTVRDGGPGPRVLSMENGEGMACSAQRL
jgi:hypothetical protein